MNIQVVKEILNKQCLDIEDLIVYVLARIYSRVNWGRIVRGIRDPLDVFQHRVLVASYTDKFSKFIERLCRLLGIQSIRIETEVINVLEENNDKVLDKLRHESIVLVCKAYDLYKKLREVKKTEGVRHES